jgi:hypothetical protein
MEFCLDRNTVGSRDRDRNTRAGLDLERSDVTGREAPRRPRAFRRARPHFLFHLRIGERDEVGLRRTDEPLGTGERVGERATDESTASTTEGAAKRASSSSSADSAVVGTRALCISMEGTASIHDGEPVCSWPPRRGRVSPGSNPRAHTTSPHRGLRCSSRPEAPIRRRRTATLLPLHERRSSRSQSQAQGPARRRGDPFDLRDVYLGPQQKA